MNLYRFKTFTTSYYFPEVSNDKKYLYGLYSPYGGKLSRLYWYLFTHFSLVRKLTKVREEDLDFPYDLIKKAERNDSLMSFNLGSPGREQKISILGYDHSLQQRFFAKFSQKPDARALSINEIEVLKKLQGTGLVPALYPHEINDEYVFLKTACINGARPTGVSMNTELLHLLFSLADISAKGPDENAELRYAFAHGDFCPWNMLVTEGGLRLIDWEMAADRPLGYDLFTYIFQTAFLLNPSAGLQELLAKNKDWVVDYFTHFGIGDWKPYLASFTDYKIEKMRQTDNQGLLQLFLKLKMVL